MDNNEQRRDFFKNGQVFFLTLVMRLMPKGKQRSC